MIDKIFNPFFLIAIALLVGAHVVRTLRWRILLSSCDIRVTNIRPLTALSIGYIFNTLLPFRIGEIFRTWFLSYSTRSGFSTVLGTVAVERLIDLLVLGLILSIAIIFYQAEYGILFLIYIPLIVLFFMLLGVRVSLQCRRVSWFLASVFNEKIKFALLNFLYVVTDLLFKRLILRSRFFWILTLVMWGLYLMSLMILSRLFDESFLFIFNSIYVYSIDLGSNFLFGVRDYKLLIYLSLPIPIILAYAYVSGFNGLAKFRGALREITRVENYITSSNIGRLHGFRSDTQYHSFLERFFCGKQGLLYEFEQRGIDGVQVHRIFWGGSGAITALIEVDDHLRVRKFASGALASKLVVQYDWLVNYTEFLPLVNVLEMREEAGDFSYDMSYIGGSLSLYEAIHTEPLEKSIRLIDDVVDVISKFHRSTLIKNAADSVVLDYINNKILANFKIIEREFQDIFELGVVELNGEPFELSKLNIFKDCNWFLAQIQDRRQSSIHGDLTIENIMVDASMIDGRNWFLIDPNPINGLQSPLIDFAKLMQSLHLGYEGLHKLPRAHLSEGRLSVALHRSAQYERLHSHILENLTTRFGQEIKREIDIHEWVNYLRLIPYQLRASREAGLAFFGCLCLLVREFDRAYPGLINK